jgi:hypothetical protein
MTTFHCPKCRKAFSATAATAEQPQHVANELARSSAERCCWSPDCVDCGDAGLVIEGPADPADPDDRSRIVSPCPHCTWNGVDHAVLRLRLQARLVGAALDVIAASGAERDEAISTMRRTLTMPGLTDG